MKDGRPSGLEPSPPEGSGQPIKSHLRMVLYSLQASVRQVNSGQLIVYRIREIFLEQYFYKRVYRVNPTTY